MIWYGHPDSDAPDLHWNKPYVSSSAKNKIAQDIPVPAHCKPWIDGQSAGLIVTWPFPTLLLEFDKITGNLITENEHVSKFADGHYSLNPMYYFRTQENVGIYIQPHESSPLEHFTVKGIIETDWYRPCPFFVFRNPIKDSMLVQDERLNGIIIKRGDPLIELVPIVIDKGLQRMTDDQLEQQIDEANEYFNERFARKDLLWTSPTGQGFSRYYKEKSRATRFRNH